MGKSKKHKRRRSNPSSGSDEPDSKALLKRVKDLERKYYSVINRSRSRGGSAYGDYTDDDDVAYRRSRSRSVRSSRSRASSPVASSSRHVRRSVSQDRISADKRSRSSSLKKNRVSAWEASSSVLRRRSLSSDKENNVNKRGQRSFEMFCDASREEASHVPSIAANANQDDDELIIHNNLDFSEGEILHSLTFSISASVGKRFRKRV
ncbi:hypothetical protein PPYR_15686 [Photinus pyralis]|uniref:Uncharacterized protein n=1 Tax=Photinus pyralis TaxID=7054 RepID=A0A5N3ZY80_PHOPY|nr:hypothetical protein PPYR_15686 [Photinus pyralis]